MIDDDPSLRRVMKRWLGESDYEPMVFGSISEFNVRTTQPRVVCLDVDLPDGNGLNLLSNLTAEDPDMPVIMLTSSGDAETAVRAMQIGAYDYIVKPPMREVVMLAVNRAMERRCLTELLAKAAVGPNIPDGLVGDSAVVQEILRQVDRLRDSEQPVCITGPSGCGKEQLARKIHQDSARAAHPLVVLRAADLPTEHHVEELLGRGGDGGRFAQAEGGSLFVGDLGALAYEAQCGLWDRLRDQMQSNLPASDVRIITSCRRPLNQLLEEGRLQPHLRQVIDTHPIHLPGLAQRRDDIPALVALFLGRFAAERCSPVRRVSSEAMAQLMQADWPGNIRELETVVRRASLSAEGEELLCRHLPEELRLQDEPLLSSAEVVPLRVLEGREIRKALRLTSGSVDKAAKLLGIGRATLYRRISRRPDIKPT